MSADHEKPWDGKRNAIQLFHRERETNAELRAEVKLLQEALSFYAENDGSIQHLAAYAQDRGKTARKALDRGSRERVSD